MIEIIVSALMAGGGIAVAANKAIDLKNARQQLVKLARELGSYDERFAEMHKDYAESLSEYELALLDAGEREEKLCLDLELYRQENAYLREDNGKWLRKYEKLERDLRDSREEPATFRRLISNGKK